MSTEFETEVINCPYCYKGDSAFQATENGYTAAKCNHYGLVYVNPDLLLP